MSGDNKVVYQNLNPTETMPTMANGMLRNPLKTITLAAADLSAGADWDTVIAATSGITCSTFTSSGLDTIDFAIYSRNS